MVLGRHVVDALGADEVAGALDRIAQGRAELGRARERPWRRRSGPRAPGADGIKHVGAERARLGAVSCLVERDVLERDCFAGTSSPSSPRTSIGLAASSVPSTLLAAELEEFRRRRAMGLDQPAAIALIDQGDLRQDRGGAGGPDQHRVGIGREFPQRLPVTEVSVRA